MTVIDYITSDTHFGHNNIVGPEGFEVGRRIFADAKEMDDAIFSNFNAKVTNNDHTYHLGDVTLNMKPEDTHTLLANMNGSFTIVMGNHDNRKLFKYLDKMNFLLPNGRPKYELVEVGLRLKANKKMYYLSHFPLLLGNNRAIYRNLCGHIHSEVAPQANGLNVGVDSPEIEERPFGEPLLLEDAYRLVDEKWERWKQNGGEN